MNSLKAVERAAAKAAASRAALETAILDAHTNGASLRSIAEAAGISHEQVRRILNKQ